MGKGAIIGAIALSFLAILTLVNTQSISRDTSDKQIEFQTGFMAKELAMKGRKLVISSWIQNSGTRADDIGTLNEDGGTMALMSDSIKQLNGNLIAFTIRGIYDGTVHDVTSRFRWGAPITSPLQLKVADMDLTVSPTATLNMQDIAIDTQGLDDLQQTVVTDLGLVPSLHSLGLGASYLTTEIETELTTAFGSSDIGVHVIDQSMRDEFSQSQEGMHYPDQVIQLVNDYASTHPGSEQTFSDDSSLPSTFGASGPRILRVEDNVQLSSDLAGEGVLFIEGDFEVPAGVTLNWVGIVIVAPPQNDLTGTINLLGNVTINGTLVIAQEGVPNTGHMDLTIHNNLTGTWVYPWGTGGTANKPWLKHTHDFSGLKGTQVGFTSTQPGFPVHASETQFDSFLSGLSASDSLIFEFVNPSNHGLATLTMDINGLGFTSSRAAAGFDDLIKSPANEYESIPIRVSDLRHVDISVNRLSSLKKLWDDGNDYPGCYFVLDKKEGPDCVGGTYPSRFSSFALRIHTWDGSAKQHVYDASLYWHRNKHEEEDYEDEMDDLIADIQSNDYGMDLNIGPNTTLTVDLQGINAISSFTNGTAPNITNLGTRHRHWTPDDPKNPLYVVTP